MKGTGGGEIVQVQGGHILRSTGRKDRHSKVYTAKGPRDRRVRLSAHTAIQFYDVQDRLGCDRPSKAVDWLIHKAKNAIDGLAELPPWNPSDNSSSVLVPNNTDSVDVAGSSTSMAALEQQHAESPPGYVFQLQKQIEDNPTDNGSYSSYMTPATETKCIADTMKTFFPTSSGISMLDFQNYPHDVMSRAASVLQNEDLGLSLHTMHQPNRSSADDQVQFSAAGWDHDGENNNKLGLIFSSSQSIISQHMHPWFLQSSQSSLHHHQHQREPLQSNSYPQFIHANWDNLSLSAADQNHHAAHQSSMSSSGQFASEFHVPASIQGEEGPGVSHYR